MIKITREVAKSGATPFHFVDFWFFTTKIVYPFDYKIDIILTAQKYSKYTLYFTKLWVHLPKLRNIWQYFYSKLPFFFRI